MYDSYLLSQIKDKFSSQKISQEIISNKAHQKTNLDTNKRHNIMNILSNIRIYKCLK